MAAIIKIAVNMKYPKHFSMQGFKTALIAL
jgi:hypothetical protein